MGAPELAEDSRFINNQRRIENYDALYTLINDWTSRHTMEELDALISGVGIPFGTVLTMDRVCEQEVLRNRYMLWSVYDPGIGENIEMPGSPIKMHGSLDDVRCAAPTIGQHSGKLLQELLGYSEEKIQNLRSTGVI